MEQSSKFTAFDRPSDRADSDEVRRLAERIRAGDRRSLARGITLVESTRREHAARARELLTRLLPYTGEAVRVGISGAPGVGKSTFIEALGGRLTGREHRVAVLAVDPSSSITGGSILGDKTRMEKLSANERAFVRPSPAGGSLGGVARRTRESMLLCEAAGFDAVIVETVGVGQSETAVSEMTDAFVLLLQPGGGDDLQGIKRGILELADVVVVNKADGGMADAAAHSAADYATALQLLSARTEGWRVPVKTCSSLTGAGMSEVWESVEQYIELLKADARLAARRSDQSVAWMWRATTDGLVDALKRDSGIKTRVAELERAVRGRDMPATAAAREIIDLFLNRPGG